MPDTYTPSPSKSRSASGASRVTECGLADVCAGQLHGAQHTAVRLDVGMVGITEWAGPVGCPRGLARVPGDAILQSRRLMLCTNRFDGAARIGVGQADETSYDVQLAACDSVENDESPRRSRDRPRTSGPLWHLDLRTANVVDVVGDNDPAFGVHQRQQATARLELR